MPREKGKKSVKKKTPSRRVKKAIQKPPVVAPAPEKKTPLARTTFVLNRVVIVSSISAYVIALVLAGLSAFAEGGIGFQLGNPSPPPPPQIKQVNTLPPSVGDTLLQLPGGGQVTQPVEINPSLGLPSAQLTNPLGSVGFSPSPISSIPDPLAPAQPAAPQPPATGNIGDLKTNLGLAGDVAYPGGGPANIGVYIAKFLLYFFGALGMMFSIYIFYAGFLWLTAAGEEDKVKKARAIIFHSIFALAICVMAFTISKFWLEGLAKAAR